MSTWQFSVQILSWLFIFYLHIRNLRKSEISKLKENILTTLDKLPETYCKKLDYDEISVLDAEETLSMLVNRIEFQVISLNKYANKIIFEPSRLSVLRSIELTEHNLKKESIDRHKLEKSILEKISDLTEEIESSYITETYSKNPLRSFIETRRYEIKGATFGALLIYVYSVFFQIIY
ncbi:hypothetical protein [Shewanella pealeana]|nr:hypothetical protein [Shewanella pealeana]